MLHTIPLIRSRATACVSLVIGMAFMAGCAQQRPEGYYDTPHDSTQADAQKQAQGPRGARAPSQLQFGFGETDAAQARKQAQTVSAAETPDGTTAPAKARPLLEAKTFLGTVPCIGGEANCPASRITLTLAPSGEWRSRTVLLDTPGTDQPIIQQGCWDVSNTEPLRIVIQSQDQASNAGFTFINDNVLRVNMYNNVKPILDYHLTRQADIDPIDELAGQPALVCD